MPLRVIFLDFDGVINSEEWLHTRPMEGLYFDPRMVARVNTLVEETDARIVISSSWRYGRSVDYLSGLLEGYGLHAKIIGATPLPCHMPTPPFHARGFEIQAWLDANPVEACCILDDADDMAHLLPWLVHTSWAKGLQDADVAAAKVLLEQPFELPEVRW